MLKYNFAKHAFEVNFASLWVIPWLFGILLAKGPLSVIFAFLIPPYGWYLVIEFFANKYLF